MDTYNANYSDLTQFEQDYFVLSANLEFWAERLAYYPDDTYAVEHFYLTVSQLLARATTYAITGK